MANPTMIPADLLALMKRGVSCIVASRDAAMKPSVMRALASDVTNTSITVFVARRQSRQLVQDIAANGHIAVVFSHPASHRTVQVKATRASLRNATQQDKPLFERYLASMEHELAQIHIPVPLTRAMLAHCIDDVVAITFEPEQAFDQTPGPQAGVALR
ncbi:hypothetical protein GHT07_13365 [Caenimonas koreensis DSM 17982]|uniref:Pyridoxamine 5'-phosphate oxidase putative domain-containing protein n=1 Tax=Caenimonas koreensis DSM 17982 TaxID=1121255 RepID=A0A844B4X5_9BURK|nr:hypothetical protein [Caenimonas koreensis]MRD48273.1 hypothetical protein [Caenimonas koreensis DSM 17982]